MNLTYDIILLRSLQIEPLRSFFESKKDCILAEMNLSDYEDDFDDEVMHSTMINSRYENVEMFGTPTLDADDDIEPFDLNPPAIPLASESSVVNTNEEGIPFGSDIFDSDLGLVGPVLLEIPTDDTVANSASKEFSTSSLYMSNPNGISVGPRPMPLSFHQSSMRSHISSSPLSPKLYPQFFDGGLGSPSMHQGSSSYFSKMGTSMSAAVGSLSDSSSAFGSLNDFNRQFSNISIGSGKGKSNIGDYSPSNALGQWSYAKRSPELRPKKSSTSLRSGSVIASNESVTVAPRLSPSQKQTEITWDVVMQLHSHVDSYIVSTLPTPEPSKFTDDFTQWVNYDPNLTGIDRERLYDEWFRRAGGRSGRSLSRLYDESEKEKWNRSMELKVALAKLWTVKGKLYPFTKAENAVWRKNGSGKRNDPEINLPNTVLPVSPNAAKVKSGALRDKLQEYEKDKDKSTVAGDDDWYASPKKPRRPNRSGEADFHRAIVAPCSTIDAFTHIFTSGSSSSIVNKSDSQATLISDGAENFTPQQYISIMRCFARDTNVRVLRFPMGLDSAVRRQLHEESNRLGLRTMSFGDGNKRFLVTMKRDVVVFKN
ncbi:hypothetical protein HK098_003129 [Nowakowskiella sp. JEL0407]|nr:hypothetical protein HK098_003129 [Nowakowskiella sp. JEL0407]